MCTFGLCRSVCECQRFILSALLLSECGAGLPLRPDRLLLLQHLRGVLACVKTPDTPFVHVVFSHVGAISCEFAL